MPNANLGSALNKLHHAMATLQAEWDATRLQWNDEVREAFERSHIDPLGPAVSTAMIGIRQINDVIVQLHKLCAVSEEIL
jgi:hypothetical protein